MPSGSFGILKVLSLTAIATTALLIVGCESEQDRQLAKAQSCLDEARTAPDADRCIDIVQGLEDQQAYLMRCSANMIAQGVRGERIAKAFDAMNQNTGGSNSTTKMLAYLVFDETLTRHNVATTVDNCNRSNVESMIQLAAGAKMATTLAGWAPGGTTGLNPNDPATFNPDTLKTVVDQLAGGSATDAQKEELAGVAQTANAAYCSEGSSFKDEDICKKLQGAISSGGNDPVAIGNALIALLSQNN